MKRLLLILMCAAMLWGVMRCQDAQADRWVRTRTLPEGYYVICAMLADDVPFCGPVAYIEGSDANTEELCEILNQEPLTPPGAECIYFLWFENGWMRQPPPCKYLPES